MALWGNNDNVGSGGTVTLDYSTRIVTGFNGVGGAAGEAGSGTTFGQTGFAKTGDTISFGQHGSGTYFGDAVIASIGSTLQLTIASTCGLVGGGITGVEYQISQKPTWIPADSHYSAAAEAPSVTTIDTGEADTAVGVGSLSPMPIPSYISTKVGTTLINMKTVTPIATVNKTPG